MGVDHLTVFVGQGTVVHARLSVGSLDRAEIAPTVASCSHLVMLRFGGYI